MSSFRIAIVAALAVSIASPGFSATWKPFQRDKPKQTEAPVKAVEPAKPTPPPPTKEEKEAQAKQEAYDKCTKPCQESYEAVVKKQDFKLCPDLYRNCKPGIRGAMGKAALSWQSCTDKCKQILN